MQVGRKLQILHDTRIAKLVYEYTARGRRKVGGPRKRWRDF